MIHAICLTLFHSLWQGILAALLAGGVLLTTRKATPRLRYNLLVLIFFGLLLCTGATFAWEICRSSDPSSEAAMSGPAAAIDPGTSPGPNVHAMAGVGASAHAASRHDDSAGVLSRFGRVYVEVSDYCDEHAALIVWGWMLILLARLTGTGMSLGYVRNIRRNHNVPAPETWQARMAELARMLGLRRPVVLLESAIVRVPMVLGYLKPVVLVPLGILAQMPQDQLEAVLLHELAHIRRGDYLVNILQGIVEAMLFFNPAIWWLSSLIREERENCCDDIAILASPNKSHLIHALVAFQEYSMTGPLGAVAFPGTRRNHLLERVKRIVYHRNKTLNAMEKILLGACLVMAGSLTLAFAPVKDPQYPREVATLFYRTLLKTHDTIPTVQPVAPAAPTPAPVTPVIAASPSAPVAAPAPPLAMAPVSPARPVHGVHAKDTVPPVAPTPPANAPIAPQPATPATPAEAPAPYVGSGFIDNLEGGNYAGELVMENGKIQYARGIWTKGNIKKYFDGDTRIVTVNGVITEIYKGDKKLSNDEMNAYKEKAKLIMAQLNQERDGHSDASPSGNGNVVTVIGHSADAGSGQSTSVHNATNSTHATSTHSSSGSGNITHADNYTTGSTAVVNVDEHNASSDNKASGNEVDAIVEDIMSQGLAKDPTHLRFSLDSDNFLVNGVRQPKETFQAFKGKYIYDKGDRITYSRAGTELNTSISRSRP